MNTQKQNNKWENEKFETLMGQIENVVHSLEKGDLPLEDSLKAYEEGVQLINVAQNKIEKMETRIEKLKSDGQKTSLNADEMAAVHQED